MFNRHFRSFITATALAISVFGSAHAASQKRAVIELFTSQGCSSCPPADKILAEYAQSKDVLALSWHVDYWNYLGWKDTFSKADFTNRQRQYGAAFRQRSIYTPEAVVNGRDHVVGSRRNDLVNLIDTLAKAGQGVSVPLNVEKSASQVRISADNTGDTKSTLWLVYYNKSEKVKIKRGENRGETITYHNIVRDVSMLGMAKNGKVDVTLPLDALKMKGHDACALILQASTANGLPGPILGATVIENLRGS